MARKILFRQWAHASPRPDNTGWNIGLLIIGVGLILFEALILSLSLFWMP